MLLFCLASVHGQGKDPATGLAVIPAAETIFAGKSYGFQPGPLPGGIVCKSTMKGGFYALSNMNVKDNKIKVSAVVAWYGANLSGFKKVQGYVSQGAQNTSGRSQTAFYNPAGTMVVLITGSAGKQGEDTNTYGIAYQHYEPGLSEKTIASLTQKKIVCQ